MFNERLRSHHDAERKLKELLGMREGRAMSGDQWLRLETVLHEKPEKKNAAIYIHVPWCDRICSFCNLNRRERQGADMDAYTDSIVSELESWGAFPYFRNREIEAVYFGGGTPAVLNEGQFRKILSALRKSFSLARNCEITVESTQHNLGPDKAAALEAAGINRLSIGIQTFSGRGRELLGRSFPEKKAKEELLALRQHFGGILGIDIIYDYPGQTLDELRQDADLCVSSGIDSISFYPLMIQQKSLLSDAIERGDVEFTRDIASEMERHHLFYQTLKDAGFALLELSKFVRPGTDRYRYIHFQYGEGDVIPAGSGAGGTIAGFTVYSMAGRRMVSAPEPRYRKYHHILGLLQFGAYDPALIAGALGPKEQAAVMETMTLLAGEGLLEAQAGKNIWTPTADGVFWGNNMAVKVLEAAIAAGENSEE